MDDAFFNYAPLWVHERCGAQIFPITDIARLYYLKDYLAKGYERVVWVDADVLVFDHAVFDIDVPSDYAFSREVMMGVDNSGRIQLSSPSLNNAVMFFRQGNPMLDFYCFAAEEIVRRTAPDRIERTALGPSFLRGLARSMPIARLNCIGLFTPVLIADLAKGSTRLFNDYCASFRYPMGAANLCHFTRHYAAEAERSMIDRTYDSAIRFLLSNPRIDGVRVM
ncbi:hypothetical protein [Rhodocyclus tenuis]|uniref:hypothetical protein n=1 Tax=Rhodocyclus tenuis TaxID=1066 RepID=UPI00190633C2|nr:hypothetical protein [Rhodocyclus tenuis]